MGIGKVEQDGINATQRLFPESQGQLPQEEGAPVAPRPSAAATANRRLTPEQRKASAAARRKREKIAIISLCSAAAVLLLAVIIIITTVLFKAPTDNGLILNNVFAAGVDLSGMTREQAKKALHAATDDTYSRLDMSVQVLDSTILLSPKDTGARLDVDAVAEAAYNYGRTGSRSEQQQAKEQAQNSSYTISILPYLSLDTTYIQSTIRNLGMEYSTTLSQTRWEVKGERPSMDILGDVDTMTTHQTLYIYLGTAEYGLVTTELYEQILDAYNINIFQVVGKCSVVAPTPLDYEAIWNQLCVAPVDATIDPVTYAVTPEKIGYGFTLEELTTKVDNAEYGSVVTLPLKYLVPAITSETISGELFQDLLSSFQTTISTDENWNTNLQLAVDAINGTIVRAGEEFSFNTALGEMTTDKGYRNVVTHVGKFLREVTGGGVSQVASTLYNAVILADLDVIERHNHTYIPSYVNMGFDAYVSYGTKDLRFMNTTELPIKIQASIVGNTLNIDLIGTNTREYRVEILYEVVETVAPKTLYNTMLSDNPAGYKEGDVLVQGIAGTTIRTKLCMYTKDTFTLIEERLIAESEYDMREQVVVDFYEPPTEEPTDPSSPSEPTGSTRPTGNTEPTGSTTSNN